MMYSQKLLALTKPSSKQGLIRQAMYLASTVNGRFNLGFTPKAMDHKLWKNGLEVSKLSRWGEFPRD